MEVNPSREKPQKGIVTRRLTRSCRPTFREPSKLEKKSFPLLGINFLIKDHPFFPAHQRVLPNRHQGMSETPKFDWKDFALKLPVGKDKASQLVRDKAFDVADTNGNGVLSLAEFDRALREILSSDYHLRVFHAKPAIMRAFQAAKRSGKGGGFAPPGLNPTDYVDRHEFRLLLAYLREYFELYLMFQGIDGQASIGDGMVTRDEFDAALPKIKRWGLRDEDDTTFDKIDRDSSGTVRFDEFADWALRNRLDLEDDDDVEITFEIPVKNFADADAERKHSQLEHQHWLSNDGQRPTTPPQDDDGRPLDMIVSEMAMLRKKRREAAQIRAKMKPNEADDPMKKKHVSARCARIRRLDHAPREHVSRRITLQESDEAPQPAHDVPTPHRCRALQERNEAPWLAHYVGCRRRRVGAHVSPAGRERVHLQEADAG